MERLKNFFSLVKQNKLVFLIGLVVLIISLWAFYLLVNPGARTNNDNTISNLPTQSSAPLPTIYPPESVIFEVLSVYPGEGEIEITGPNEAVGVRFSRSIELNSVEIEVTPNIDFTTSYDEENNVLYIHPSEFWELEREHRFSVSARSTEGEELPKPYNFSFNPRFPIGNESGVGDEHENSGLF